MMRSFLMSLQLFITGEQVLLLHHSHTILDLISPLLTPSDYLGTTAAGLRAGKPTLICPFFGDQPFWGEMIFKAAVGPEPCPVPQVPFLPPPPPTPSDVLKQVTLDRISKKFFSLLLPEITANAQLLSEKLEAEDGVGNALSSFYRHLHIENMICDISIFFGEAQLAHVWCPQCGFKMTREVSECIHNPPPAMATAATAGGTGAKVHEEDMRSHQIVPCTYVNWSLNRGPTTASEGVIQGLGGATHELVAGLTDTVLEPIHAIFKGNGLTGAMEGVVQGLRGFIISPISGGQILLSKVSEGFKNSLSQPTLPDPNHRFTRDGSIRRPDGSVYGNPFAEEFSTSLHPHSQPLVGPPPGPPSDLPVTAEVPMSSDKPQSERTQHSIKDQSVVWSTAFHWRCLVSSPISLSFSLFLLSLLPHAPHQISRTLFALAPLLR